ncbi:hypothetical protein [Taibaiella lutea]|nr:hypothetical protein [Taibaiella lutea]
MAVKEFKTGKPGSLNPIQKNKTEKLGYCITIGQRTITNMQFKSMLM